MTFLHVKIGLTRSIGSFGHHDTELESLREDFVKVAFQLLGSDLHRNDW